MAVICVFEDELHDDLIPLVYSRPACELRCGISSLLDKIVRAYEGQKFALFCRDFLADTLRQRTTFPVNELPPNQDVLFLNGRLLIGEPVAPHGREEVGLCGGSLVYARLEAKNAAALTPRLFLEGSKSVEKVLPHGTIHRDCKATLLRYYWEIVDHNEEELRRDFKALAAAGEIRGKVHDGCHVLGRENVFIGKDAVIKPGCVIDAEHGPVYIAEGVTVMPNSCIQGPAYIGPSSTIQMAARLREGTNIGEVCKVGGEVEDSIIHSYSNKQHDGFLGHAYIGQWVNLAADTINSDLKNTYGTVRVKLPHVKIDTDSMFVGLAMGDHTKSAIASNFLTGSVVGYYCNVVTSGFPPEFLPSFSWLDDKGWCPYSPDQAVEVARRVLERRGKQLTHAEAALIHKLYDLTQPERDALSMDR